MDRSVFKKVVIPSFLTTILVIGAVFLIDYFFPREGSHGPYWQSLAIAGLIVFIVCYFSFKKKLNADDACHNPDESKNLKKELRNFILWFIFYLLLAIMCLVGHPTTHDIILGIIFSLCTIGSAWEIICCYKKIKEQKS